MTRHSLHPKLDTNVSSSSSKMASPHFPVSPSSDDSMIEPAAAVAAFREVAHAVPALLWSSGVDGACTFVNQAWDFSIGAPLDRMFGDKWLEQLHPDDRMPAWRDYHAAFDAREPFAIEYRLHFQEGEYRWIYMRGAPRFSQGVFLGFVGSGFDVTDRKLAVEKLLAEQERYDLVVRGSADGVWDWQIDQGNIYYSDRYVELLGYEISELPKNAEQWREQIHPDDFDEMQERLRMHLDHRLRYDLDLRMRAKDGEYRWFRVSGQAIWDETGRAVRMAGSISDISERKRVKRALVEAQNTLEERVAQRTAELAAANAALLAEAAERRKAEAARNLVLRKLITVAEEQRRRIARELHDEMGQLVVGLKLGLKLLASDREDAESFATRVAELNGIAETIGTSAHNLAAEIRPSVLDDIGLVPAVSSYVDQWSKKSQIPVDFEASVLRQDEISVPIATTIYRIVQEGLTNIAKHARATHVDVIIRQQPDHLLLMVEDNGVGMASVTMPFENETGQGLYGIRERAELLGGTLTIESQAGQGSTLFIRLPMV